MRVGVLGGGQLGRMLALAGYRLGIEFRFFDPNSGAPVGQIGELIAADYGDEDALKRFLDGVDVVTYEFESIPASTIRFVAERVKVFPPVAALETAQDRLLEKNLFQEPGIPTPTFAPVDRLDDLRNAAARIGFPLILKTRRMGYDGKGQVVIRDASAVDGAWKQLGGSPLLVEQYVLFQHELSVIGVRDSGGHDVFYPPIENLHREGVLRRSIAPAPSATPMTAALAIDYCRRLMDRLEYVGVLALELFSVDGSLLANEMAPRVHNSGHWTIEGAETSQFENHLRAILSLPLGAATPRGRSVMLNIIGHIPPVQDVLAVEGAHLHLYGKAPTEKRKVGHVTLVAQTAEEADKRPVSCWGAGNPDARAFKPLSRSSYPITQQSKDNDGMPAASNAFRVAMGDSTDVALAAGGDRQAFERLYRTHANRVYSLCTRMCGSRVQGEELTQDVFVRTWEKLPQFRGESAFSTWLHRLAVNVVLNARKTEGKQASRTDESDVDDERWDVRARAPMHIERMDLSDAIAKLPAGARRVFVLHDVEGYKHEEIAEMCGITSGGSKAQLHRARLLLREALER